MLPYSVTVAAVFGALVCSYSEGRKALLKAHVM